MSSSYLVFRNTVRSLAEEDEILNGLLNCGYSDEAIATARVQIQAEDALLVSVLGYEQGATTGASAAVIALAQERVRAKITDALTILPRSA